MLCTYDRRRFSAKNKHGHHIFSKDTLYRILTSASKPFSPNMAMFYGQTPAAATAAQFPQRLSVYGAPVLLSHVFPVPGVPPSSLRFDVRDGRIVPQLAVAMAPTTADVHDVAQTLVLMHRQPRRTSQQ